MCKITKSKNKSQPKARTSNLVASKSPKYINMIKSECETDMTTYNVPVDCARFDVTSYAIFNLYRYNLNLLGHSGTKFHL